LCVGTQEREKAQEGEEEGPQKEKEQEAQSR
jgi:hypothetical protein